MAKLCRPMSSSAGIFCLEATSPTAVEVPIAIAVHENCAGATPGSSVATETATVSASPTPSPAGMCSSHRQRDTATPARKYGNR